MAQTCYDPTAWVIKHKQLITATLNSLGLEFEEPRSTLGLNMFHKVSDRHIAACSQDMRDHLLMLVTEMGLFEGNSAPVGEAPDHILVPSASFPKLVHVIRPLIGKHFICLPSTRRWNQHTDGPQEDITATAARFATSKWCQWANSPGALRRADSVEPILLHPHDSLYGMAGLAVLLASEGGYDLTQAHPAVLNEWKNDFPTRLRLEGKQGSAVIYPHPITGQAGEQADLRHWIRVASQNLFLRGSGSTLHVATHAPSVMHIGNYATSILQNAWPNCRIAVIAAPIAQADRPAWLSEALQQVAILIARSE